MDIKLYLQAPVPRWLALTATIATGVAATGVTYFATRQKFYKDLDAMVEEQVANTKHFFESYKKPSPVEIAKDLEIQELEGTVSDLIQENGYRTSEPEPTAEPELHEISRNIFTDAMAGHDFDFEKEVPLRSSEKPYVIEHDEFYESDRQTITLTWFEGDEVLADEKDEHIPNPDHVVGDENLQRFGYGSRDPNIVYVRNETMDIDFEIVKNDGKYTEQVLGFMQHDDKIGVRKFRTYDD